MSFKKTFFFIISVISFVLLNSSLWAYDPNEAGVLADKTPVELEGVGVTEHLGSKLDLDIDFVDQNGVPVKLAQYFGSKPVIFSIVYYDCPSLCNLHLNGLTDALKQLKWTAGNQFDVVALSMNPRETPELAAAKMQSYIDSYGRPESAKGWHFLTGSEENIKKIADQVGFSFKWIEGSQEYSHASAAQVITASGTVSRYLHGIQFDPQTVRLALLEASEGKIGNIVDQFVLYCFQFDPTKKKYTLYAYRIMQAGGVLIVLVLAILLIPYWIRERKQIA